MDVQGKMPRAAWAGARAHVYTNTTDRNGWTGGQTGSRVAHVPPGSAGAQGSVYNGAGLPPQHGVQVPMLQVPSRGSQCWCPSAHPPQQRGHTHHREWAGGAREGETSLRMGWCFGADAPY